jgi:hypothetical protein
LQGKSDSSNLSSSIIIILSGVSSAYNKSLPENILSKKDLTGLENREQIANS